MLAQSISKRSKCVKAHYGAVLVDVHDRIIATGYNGHPKNTQCDDKCLRTYIKHGTQQEIGYCLHAEWNCLLHSNFAERQRGTIYVSDIPCNVCHRMILQSGVSRLVFVTESKVSEDFLRFHYNLYLPGAEPILTIYEQGQKKKVVKYYDPLYIPVYRLEGTK